MEKSDFLDLIYSIYKKIKEKNMKCFYRNCENEIGDDKRKDAKFCKTSCRKMEQTYRKRKKALIEKYAAKEMEIVNTLKKIEEIIRGGIQK